MLIANERKETSHEIAIAGVQIKIINLSWKSINILIFLLKNWKNSNTDLKYCKYNYKNNKQLEIFFVYSLCLCIYTTK